MLSNTATATSRQFSKRTTLLKCSENMASFAKARDELLVAYDEGTIDDEEFALLWEQNVSKNPSFPYIGKIKILFVASVLKPIFGGYQV